MAEGVARDGRLLVAASSARRPEWGELAVGAGGENVDGLRMVLVLRVEEEGSGRYASVIHHLCFLIQPAYIA